MPSIIYFRGGLFFEVWQKLIVVYNPLIAELILKYRCFRFQKIAYFVGVYKTVARFSIVVPFSRTIFYAP